MEREYTNRAKKKKKAKTKQKFLTQQFAQRTICHRPEPKCHCQKRRKKASFVRNI